jgi:hypothetical protein
MVTTIAPNFTLAAGEGYAATAKLGFAIASVDAEIETDPRFKLVNVRKLMLDIITRSGSSVSTQEKLVDGLLKDCKNIMMNIITSYSGKYIDAKTTVDYIVKTLGLDIRVERSNPLKAVTLRDWYEPRLMTG